MARRSYRQLLRRSFGLGGAATFASLGLVTSASFAAARAQPPPGGRLLGYLWNYEAELLRPYVTGVRVTSGHMVVVDGKSRLAGATANVHVTLRDESSSAKGARFICQAAAAGVRKLHLGTMSAVQVWSVEGHLVARC